MSAIAKLYIWRNRGLFLGTREMPARDFTTGSDQLIVCLKGTMTRRFPGGKTVAFRSVLLRAGTKVPMQQVTASGTIIAICHLDPVGQDYHAVAQKMAITIENNAFHHQDEDLIIQELSRIVRNDMGDSEAYHCLDNLLLPAPLQRQTFIQFDPRVVRVLRHIETTVRDNIEIAQLAEQVFLSESRLVKLFKNQVGIPITRYRIRFRVYVGLIYLSLGFSVTDSALAAGFSSTAHFSKCFSAILGIPPSSNLLQPPFMEVVLAEEIVAAIRAEQGAPLTSTMPAAPASRVAT
ncbi:AraC family transcriptional regulator [Halioxenophilus sp. WMMB6]|uniref:helix-turn-helix transcriptional regulator n=1 Tax=Halioxenophilus sp. WMMB6 TaxID=3073815 RepID=UPI00295E4ADA|nr:AraC family transcriptional regulator [Halioxenophilus sp. WMMB6]